MKTLFVLASVLVGLFLAAPNEVEAQRKTTEHSFEQYAVPVYRGPIAKPNFRSKPGSIRLRTVIRNGLKEGVNFAGHYAIVGAGCGTGCSFAYLVDVKSGRIFDFPLGGEKNYSLETDYRPDSSLLKARWIGNTLDDDNWSDHPMCVRQEFVLTGIAFKSLHQTKTRMKTIEACFAKP
ncbi:MAG TPA: hypothetical protein VI306_05065 [Pyrinomonadaceae bacterium]